MGASSKKKKEKQKDFQKPKLKVGKAKAKPENFTDTSFKSKSITLTQQSLTLNAPSQSTQFTHSLSLLSSKSDSQRRDSLSHLATAIASRPTLPPGDVRDHVPTLLPYLRAGMTHLAADIRLSTLDILEWLVDVAGEEVVSAPGGWVKVLKCFLSLLGWHIPDPAGGKSKWTSTGAGGTSSSGSGSGTGRVELGKAGKQGKGLIRGLSVLGVFLEAGLAPHLLSSPGQDGAGGEGNGDFPILSAVHLVPESAHPYAYLNLFGAPRDSDGEMYETQEDRYRVFVEGGYLGAVKGGVEAARQEGGEVGRVSSTIRRVLASL
ncbi:hypothetical protein P170DRAFT_455884 [Aspergillus steynii IBT 23096]|uniref:Pre-rRNA-processing protein n=1 Tax=Aspergillus steynii IBT 23096 TaxID=1392250 RepID=A0A2I2G8E7_9EURO|nr:uncharacterized protein P170DRAFT_455884 [Aspergillus steynii IBT 23096]PLB49152.1 hypothetical protein P170DRAFT_455884 [Aspergillus steynii IBT 23096]